MQPLRVCEGWWDLTSRAEVEHRPERALARMLGSISDWRLTCEIRSKDAVPRAAFKFEFACVASGFLHVKTYSDKSAIIQYMHRTNAMLLHDESEPAGEWVR